MKRFLNITAFAISVQEVGKQRLVLLLCTGGDPNAAGSSTQGLNLAVAGAGRMRGSELLAGCGREGGSCSGDATGRSQPRFEGLILKTVFFFSLYLSAVWF